MTSFGAKAVNEDGWMSTFKVQGQVYILVGLPLPELGLAYQLIQIYFKLTRVLASYLIVHYNGTRSDILLRLQQMLHEKNIYIRRLKFA